MDDADRAQLDAEALENAIAKRRAKSPYKMPEGVPGECDFCGEMSKRLINNFCAPCRDRYRL
jgi:hypothetical protein